MKSNRVHVSSTIETKPAECQRCGRVCHRDPQKCRVYAAHQRELEEGRFNIRLILSAAVCVGTMLVGAVGMHFGNGTIKPAWFLVLLFVVWTISGLVFIHEGFKPWDQMQKR